MSHDASGHDAPARGWRATLIGVCVAQATAIVGFDFTLPFIPLYLQHDLGIHGLGQTALWAGLIGFGPAIPATILGPVWGTVADRFGYRAMLLRAMVCSAILLTLMGFVPSAGVLLALRMVQGGLSGTVFSSQALVAASVPERETGRSMGLLQMSISVGATIGPVGGGATAQLFGYRAAFVGAGILVAMATSVVLLFVREPARRTTEREEIAERHSILSVLLVPAFAGALLLTLAVQVFATALFPIIPLYVQDLLHSARNVASDTGWVMAISGIASAGGAYLVGRLQRRVGLRPLLIAALMLAAVLLVPQAFVQNFVSFLLWRAAAAFAFGGLFGLVGIWAAVSSPPGAKGTAFGLMGAASSMGFGAGPLLGGALAASIGIRPVFLLSAAMVGMIPLLLGVAALAAPAWRRVASIPRPA